MARSEAEGREPTIEEINSGEMKSFQGFSTQDGVIAKGEQTAEEAAAHAQQAKLGGTKAAAALTPAAGGAEDAQDGEETPEEKAAREATAPALTEKQQAAKALQAKVGGDKDAKHRSANDRIGQAVAKQRAAERERDEERGRRSAELDELRREIAALKGGLTADPKAAKQIDKDAPRATDYEYGELDTAYIRDVARYETRKEFAVQSANQTAAQQTAEQRREAQAFQEARTKFDASGREKFDDFDEVVVEGAKNAEWPLTKEFAEFMLDSEVGPDIAYYLATHVSEAKNIMAMTPAAQARAFGRLEATFSSTSADATTQDDGSQEQAGAAVQQSRQPVQARTTQAPPPPKQRAKGAGGRTQVSADTSDFSAFERLAMGQ